MPSSAVVSFVKENRFTILLGVYLLYRAVINWFETEIFDLYYKDTLLFSKREKYCFPTAEVCLFQPGHS